MEGYSMTEENTVDTTAQPFFLEYIDKAREKKIKLEPWVLPNWLMFTCDTDVPIGVYAKTVKSGPTFLIEVDEDVNKPVLYYLSSDTLFDKVNELTEKIDNGEIDTDDEITNEDGVEVTEHTAPISFSLQLEPLKCGEHQITFVEYLVWLAVELEESDEVKKKIIQSAYQGLEPEIIDAVISNIEREKAELRGELIRDNGLPKQDTAKPRKRQDPKTKISRLIGKPESNAELYKAIGAPLSVANRSEKQRGVTVEQVVAIEYMGADGVIAEGREQLTQLDRQVHNAIISHYVAGNRVVSLVQICEFVYGHAKPTDGQMRDVEECINRQMWTKITIDMTDEAAKHTLKHPELLTNFRLEGQMLTIRKGTAQAANGKKIVAYQLMGEPILYTHAQVTGQILTYPARLLQAPKGMNNTERTMAIRQTLLEEVNRAKTGKRNRFMKYDTIYKDSGQTPHGRTERNRLNNYVRGYLDVLVNNGEIVSWKERKEGRKITGFEIFFPEKKNTAKAAKKAKQSTQ